MPKKANVVAQMTDEQAKLLRKLAFDAYEPEALSGGRETHQYAAGKNEIDE